MASTPNRSRILYLSHGGGPLPLLGDAGHAQMVETLQAIAADIPRPAAIIVISAHWESPVPALTANPAPSLIYDYRGFPDASYEIRYPCPGAPELAGRTRDLLQAAGFDAVLNDQRGLDHGVFVPMKIMYPDADIPCIQLSLIRGLDPDAHIRLGSALSGLVERDVLIVGSGFSFHNLDAFFAPATEQSRSMNRAFEDWLVDTCSSTEIDEETRVQRLVNWQQAPHARYCHPREEHLLPLHACYGAAARACIGSYRITILGRLCSFYLW